MKPLAAIAEILKREGVGFITGFPVNPIIEAAAEAGIRPIIVRQERTGVHIADGFSRISSGERVGVFVMQLGPGSENAFGGVAQAYADSSPVVILPTGHVRARADLESWADRCGQGWQTLIALTRLNGSRFTVNADLIRTIEERPDTIIVLTDGETLIVKERMKDVVARAVEYARMVRVFRP